MDKGQWVKGKESALWVNAGAGLRPGSFLAGVLFPRCARAVIFIRAVAEIGEREGDRSCSDLALLWSAVPYQPSA